MSRADQLAKACIAEGDPLPPEDVARPAPTEAIDAVFRRTRPRLLRFLARRSSSDDAEDLAQQAFVRFLSHREEAAPIEHPDNYLFRVARNLANDDYRAAQRQARAAHVALDEVELLAPDHLAALEARDLLQRLEAVLSRLKPRTREIFLAHRIDGYSYGEIAARTGLSIKGVEKHMSRAIATIDRRMRP